MTLWTAGAGLPGPPLRTGIRRNRIWRVTSKVHRIALCPDYIEKNDRRHCPFSFKLAIFAINLAVYGDLGQSSVYAYGRAGVLRSDGFVGRR